MSKSTNPQIPYLPHVITRPRLLDKLINVSQHKLTLVCAPPGYGKSTLVAQFAQESAFPVIWHNIDPHQRDVSNLHTQCIRVFMDIMPDIQTLSSVEKRTPSALASRLIDFLHDHLTEDVLYVLDDAHYLADTTGEIWLQTLVARLPGQCHLLLISRTLPKLPYSTLLSRREILAIGQEDLRFSSEEIHTLANQVFQVALSPSESEALAAHLEGWPAGIVLALQPLPEELALPSAPEALFASLSQSILDTQPPFLQDFLLNTSTLTHLTPELCHKVLSLDNSAHHLQTIFELNLFLTHTTHGFVYHQLFRDFLQQELQNRDPEHFIQLHHQAAAWFEAQEEHEVAFSHYLAAGLIENAAALADRLAHTYFARHKVTTLLDWDKQLNTYRAEAPWLSLICAFIYTDRYDYDVAEYKLQMAEQHFKTSRGLIDVQYQRALIASLRGDYTQAVALTKHLADELPEDSGKREGVLNVLGLSLVNLGDTAAGAAHLEQALQLARTNSDAHMVATILLNLEVAYLRLGRLNEADACLQEVVAIQRALDNPSALAMALNNLGYHQHQSGDYKAALTTFQEGLQVITQVKDVRPEAYLSWSMADLWRDFGNFGKARQLYTKALELEGDREPFLRCNLLISLATLYRWQENLSEAKAIATEAFMLADHHHMELEIIKARASLWVTSAPPGQHVIDLLDDAVASLRQKQAVTDLVQTLCLCAHVTLLNNDKLMAEEYLKSALHTAKTGGFLHPLVAEIKHSQLLQTLVAQQAWQYERIVEDLVQLDAMWSPVRQHAISTYSLRIQTLGPIHIERDGIPISISTWGTTLARELFLYLLLSGPDTRERLSVIFWPDSSPHKARSNFHTTLYRARQALGESVICFEDDLYLIDPDLNIWCDVVEFSKLVHQARLQSPASAYTEELWRKSIALYQGDFLPELDIEWAVSRRETWREAYLDALLGAAHCARLRQDYPTALVTLQRALEVDAYREDIHRKIMQCYADMGEKGRILKQLGRLKTLLKSELAISPSKETLILAETLLT